MSRAESVIRDAIIANLMDGKPDNVPVSLITGTEILDVLPEVIADSLYDAGLLTERPEGFDG